MIQGSKGLALETSVKTDDAAGGTWLEPYLDLSRKTAI